MSVVLSTQYYSRTTNLPSRSPWTISAWCYRATADQGGFGAVTALGSGTGNDKFEIGVSSGNAFFIFVQTPGTVTGSAFTADTWHFICATCSGDGAGAVKGYYAGNQTADISMSGDSTISAFTKFFIGNEPSGDQWAGRIAAVKIWTAALSAAEMAAEMNFAYPVRTTNINGVYLLQSNTLTDVSGQGNDLTLNGTGVTTAADPAGVDFNPISSVTVDSWTFRLPQPQPPRLIGVPY